MLMCVCKIMYAFAFEEYLTMDKLAEFKYAQLALQ